MTIVEKAYVFAQRAHAGQKDIFGCDQMAHVSSVADMFNDDERKVVALLHDVLKMTDTSYDALAEAFGQPAADAVNELTRRDDEPMNAYIARVKQNPISKEIKVAELHREMDLSKHPNVTPKDMKERDMRFRLIYQLTV